MEDWLERLINERDELAGRIRRLRKVLADPEFLENAHPEQIEIVRRQLSAMESYGFCLCQRIDMNMKRTPPEESNG